MPTDLIVAISFAIAASAGLFFAVRSEMKKKKIEAAKKEGYYTPKPIG